MSGMRIKQQEECIISQEKIILFLNYLTQGIKGEVVITKYKLLEYIKIEEYKCFEPCKIYDKVFEIYELEYLKRLLLDNLLEKFVLTCQNLYAIVINV